MTALTPPAPIRRPYLHFTPPAGWLNDPNGLVYVDGEYHLFYQHHPYSLVWGAMHWGHAVSRDLVHWEHLPIALAPDAHGAIFSGSVVIDSANSAGFGAGALVAIFTHAGLERQVQSLAFSLDRGRTWAKYAGNPVLAPADAPRDFRDPRVFRYEGASGGHWVMLLAVRDEVWIYTSPDLKEWRKVSAFGAGYGVHSGVWECPELVCLPVANSSERRWVLVVGVLQGGPAGGSGTQYFIGDFDGMTFLCSDPTEQVRWADYGTDFYAVQAWTNAPDGRTIWLAWLNNWAYARETPATTWRGMMTAPRELGLAQSRDGLVLVQHLAREVQAQRRELIMQRMLPIGPGTLQLAELRGEALELKMSVRIATAAARSFGLSMWSGAVAVATLYYDLVRQELVIERAGAIFHAQSVTNRQVVALAPREGSVLIHVLVDSASVEIFADDGRSTLTIQTAPASAEIGVQLFAAGGTVLFEVLQAWTYGGAMPNGRPTL